MIFATRRDLIRDCTGAVAVGTGVLFTGCLGENRTPGVAIFNRDSVEHVVAVTVSNEDGETVIDKRSTIPSDGDIYYEGVFAERENSVTYQAEVSVEGGITKTDSFNVGGGSGFHDLQIWIESPQTVEIAPVIR